MGAEVGGVLERPFCAAKGVVVGETEVDAGRDSGGDVIALSLEAKASVCEGE
jgi:hypothetical protein